jgi:hypothetical protein
MGMQREREEQRRQEKLDAIDSAKKDGTLTVRKMTDEERAKFPPPPEGAQRRRRPGRS